MKPRIKVSPHGDVAMRESDDPGDPWLAIYVSNLPESTARPAFFADAEVQDWPEWKPVGEPPAPGEKFSLYAKDVKVGQQVLHREGWLTLERAFYDDPMQCSLHFEGRKNAVVRSPYELLIVRECPKGERS